MTRSTRLLSAVCLTALLSLSNDCLHADEWAGEWESYTAITGVGYVSKIWPAEDDLHYSGNGVANAEIATFAVDITEARDWDRRAWWCDDIPMYWEETQVGMDETASHWSCTAGSIVDGCFAATYTPPATPMSGIQIGVVVEDNASFGNPDDTGVPRSYPEPLRAFKVGEHISTSPSGGSYTRWEDNEVEGTLPTESLHTHAAAFGNESKSDADTCTGTYTLATRPSGCNMRGNIGGFAHSYASGNHSLFAADTDLNDYGYGSLSVRLNLLVFSWSKSFLTDSDDTVAIVASAIGFGSNFGAIHEEYGPTLVSSTSGGQTIAPTFYATGQGAWSGKPGTIKEGKWDTRVEAESKVFGGTTASAEGGINATVTFTMHYPPQYED